MVLTLQWQACSPMLPEVQGWTQPAWDLATSPLGICLSVRLGSASQVETVEEGIQRILQNYMAEMSKVAGCALIAIQLVKKNHANKKWLWRDSAMYRLHFQACPGNIMFRATLLMQRLLSGAQLHAQHML